MENLLQLNLSPANTNNLPSGRTRSPGDIGDSIFKGFLDQMGMSPSEDRAAGLSLFRGPDTSDHSIMTGRNQKDGKDALQKLSNEIQKLGIPVSQLLLPQNAAPKLVSLLEKQGFDRARSNRLISSATDKNGFIQLNKLLPSLLKNNGTEASMKNNAVIQAKDIPQVEETLFKMGLKAEEVRSIIEQSVNEKGELFLNNLSAGMNKFFSGSLSESGLASLLEKLGIKTKVPAVSQVGEDPDLRKQLEKLVRDTSQDSQKEIKQNIASILDRKGIPPQEIKSFLENLNIDFAKTSLSRLNSNADESAGLLNQVFIKNNKGFNASGWSERFMEELKSSRILMTKESGGNIPDRAGKVINLADMIKQASQKPDSGKAPVLQGISKDRVWSDTGITQANGQEKDSSNVMPRDGETIAAGISMAKTERGTGQAAAANHHRANIALPEPLPKIFDRMMYMVRAGEHKSRMVITPPELGRLDLEITIKNGHLQANLGAENIMVKEIIESNLNQLKQQLSDQGLTVDSFEVMVGLGNKGFSDKEMWANKGGKKSSSNKSSVTGMDEPLPGNALSWKSPGSLYRVDVLV